MSKLENFKMIFEHIGQFDRSPRPSEISEKNKAKMSKIAFPLRAWCILHEQGD